MKHGPNIPPEHADGHGHCRAQLAAAREELAGVRKAWDLWVNQLEAMTAERDAAREEVKRSKEALGETMNQPAPRPNNREPLWHQVIADMQRRGPQVDQVAEDMQARDRKGRQKYGTPLQAHNGRDFLKDAYEEALDLTVYLRGLRVEWDAMLAFLKRLLDPEDLGLAVSGEVRDEARALLGMDRVEGK